MTVIHVDGKDAGHVMLYALSTCGWCKKTKQLLRENNFKFEYLDVDKANRADRKKAIQ